MLARFEKDGMKILDGFDALSHYQMVPKGFGRPMSVVSGDKHCILIVGDSNIIRLRDTNARDLSIKFLPPKTRYDFFIESIGNAGSTVLELKEKEGTDSEFHIVAILIVSVKERLTQNFALLFLSDNNNHATKRNHGQAASMMQIAQTQYSNQANVALTQAGTSSVIVPRDLGKPLIIDQPLPFPNQDPNKTLLGEVLLATPSAFMAPSLIRVYCCWDVGDIHHDPKIILGDTAAKSCFVEDGTNEFTFGHELGHALGLADQNTRRKRLMFDHLFPDVTFKLDQSEIDKINSSGT